MKTIRTDHNQLSVWPSDLGTNRDGTPWHAVVIGIPYDAPCEGLDVTKVYLSVTQAKELSIELDELIARIERLKAAEQVTA